MAAMSEDEVRRHENEVSLLFYLPDHRATITHVINHKSIFGCDYETHSGESKEQISLVRTSNLQQKGYKIWLHYCPQSPTEDISCSSIMGEEPEYYILEYVGNCAYSC